MGFKKLYHSLMGKGFATAAEKAELKTLAGSDEANLALCKEVDALPESGSSEQEVAAQLKTLIEAATGDVKAEYEKKFEAFKLEQKELMEKRAGLHNPEVKAARAGMNDRLRKFVGALIGRDSATLKDLKTTVDASGGYTVDHELDAEIQHLVTEHGVARREMTTVTLSKNSLKLNRLQTDLSVYWTDEASAKTSSDVAIGQVELELKKIAVIVPMTDELLEDTEIDLVGFLGGRIAEKMAEKEDLAFFKGDGTSGFGSFTGVLNNADVNEVVMAGSSFGSIDADDLLDLQDATPQGAQANAKYYLHRTIMSYVRKLKDDTGAYIYQAPSVQGPALIWGKPVVQVEAFPAKADSAEDTAFVLYGDLRKACWLGTKASGMSMMISNEATVRNTAGNADIDLFRQDMSALRVVERIGFVVVLPTAVTVLKTAAASA